MAKKLSGAALAASSLPPPNLIPFRIRIERAWKAVDDGKLRKVIVMARARDLPVNLPLDANARLPNIIKNKHCKDMRRTLATTPSLWPLLNSGIVVTAESVDIVQDGNAQYVDVQFIEGFQGAVNGGHSFAQLIHFAFGDSRYATGLSLAEVLTKDAREDGDEALAEIAEDDDKLRGIQAKAGDDALVQVEFVAPVENTELLAAISIARNKSQPVDQTGFLNLERRFEHLKQVLASAGPPCGPSLYDRIVWKPNQEVPPDSTSIPVKDIIYALALMNAKRYPPDDKIANEVYQRSGLIVREFGEAEDADLDYWTKLERIAPTILAIYDHIYATLPETDPTFPWDGKVDKPKAKKPTAAVSPFFGKACTTKVASAFLWPVFAAMRGLLVEKGNDLGFLADPKDFYDAMRQDLATRIIISFRSNAHGVVHQVGKSPEAWLRLDERVLSEVKLRKKLGTLP